MRASLLPDSKGRVLKAFRARRAFPGDKYFVDPWMVEQGRRIRCVCGATGCGWLHWMFECPSEEAVAARRRLRQEVHQGRDKVVGFAAHAQWSLALWALAYSQGPPLRKQDF